MTQATLLILYAIGGAALFGAAVGMIATGVVVRVLKTHHKETLAHIDGLTTWTRIHLDADISRYRD